MTTSHTPGPWSAMFRNSRPREYGGGIVHWETPVTVGPEHNPGNVIAIVHMGGPGATGTTQESVEANARLIAAAPDLLASLKHLLDVLHGSGYVPTVGVAGAAVAARAAIAKAAGPS